MNTDSTGLRKFFWVVRLRRTRRASFMLILILCLGGCRTINIGGSGSIGGVSGNGGISIPVPGR